MNTGKSDQFDKNTIDYLKQNNNKTYEQVS